jgi:DNA-binding NtrC family response regulator
MAERRDPRTEAVVAAVINTSPDVVDMLRRALEQAGIVAVSALTFDIREGRINLEQFIEQHNPNVIVYDIAPPYQANWQLFQHFCRLPSLAERQFVLTSTNAAHVRDLAGTDQSIYEIIGKPPDLEAIVRAVKEAARSRPVR